jgi:hypothetical protein
LIYLLKLLCRNVWNLPMNVFFQFSFCSRGTAVNFVLQTTWEEEIARIKIRWTCRPNTTADNSVPKDIGQNLHWHNVQGGQ